MEKEAEERKEEEKRGEEGSPFDLELDEAATLPSSTWY